MILVYFILLILFVLAIHFIYKNNFNKKKEIILRDSKRKIEINELENQKEIMRIKNEKLKIEVENKNRELAISTMSLVKKNEFLSHIKSELKPLQTINSAVKKVLKTINNNLNNTDDWKYFEEAFNNADKDFFKKLKSYHPKLTPNELKLCAYLRLNLTSKEIAPLFNISPKSVEIKRYRLRKKMNLDRNVSLTNYILSI
jgi:DNA-binding CsgD family transcriptional regulator